MTHIVIQEALDGKTVDWMEKASDQQIPQVTRKSMELIFALIARRGGTNRVIVLSQSPQSSYLSIYER
jgi:hypothetical protein